jgi:hypothetical protein
MSKSRMSPGRKAARTKGKAGLALAGAKAALTRYRKALRGKRGEAREQVLAQIAQAEALVAERSEPAPPRGLGPPAPRKPPPRRGLFAVLPPVRREHHFAMFSTG